MLRSKYWTQEKLVQLKTLYDSGLSMREVGEYFGKSVHAISSKMRRKNIPRRPASITRITQFNKSPLSYCEKSNLTKQEQQLKIAGLMLYWGEGAKKNKNGQINFTNADPEMIYIFILFLRRIYQIQESKLRCHLYCFNDMDISRTIQYWSKLTKIPTSQFIHPYITTNKNPTHDKISHGVCHIVYSDKRLWELIITDMHKLAKELLIS
jgi:hypothetical protein